MRYSHLNLFENGYDLHHRKLLLHGKIPLPFFWLAFAEILTFQMVQFYPGPSLIGEVFFFPELIHIVIVDDLVQVHPIMKDSRSSRTRESFTAQIRAASGLQLLRELIFGP